MVFQIALSSESLPAVFTCIICMAGIKHEWGLELYGELLATGGGKERMMAYFTVSLPAATNQFSSVALFWQFRPLLSKQLDS